MNKTTLTGLGCLIVSVACDAIPTVSAQQEQESIPDWVTRMNYDPREPFNPEELRTLLKPGFWTDKVGRRIQYMLLHAGAVKDQSFRFAFDIDFLKQNPNYEMIFAAYRYSALGEDEALDEIMAEGAALGYYGGDTAHRLVLPWIDEWDRTIVANRRHAAAPADGTAGFMNIMFPTLRPILFPDAHQAYLERIGSTGKLLNELVGVVAHDPDLTYDYGVPYGFPPLFRGSGQLTFRVKELPRPGSAPLYLVHLGSTRLSEADRQKQRTFVLEKQGDSFVDVSDTVLRDEWCRDFYLVPSRDNLIIMRRSYEKQDTNSPTFEAGPRENDLVWENGAFREGGITEVIEPGYPGPWWKHKSWRR